MESARIHNRSTNNPSPLVRWTWSDRSIWAVVNSSCHCSLAVGFGRSIKWSDPFFKQDDINREGNGWDPKWPGCAEATNWTKKRSTNASRTFAPDKSLDWNDGGSPKNHLFTRLSIMSMKKDHLLGHTKHSGPMQELNGKHIFGWGNV